jgi:hypothetical protein
MMKSNYRRPPPVSEDESIYKPDMEDLDPEFGEVELLDLEELVEGRNATDTWTSLYYLTKEFERESKGNHTLVRIKGTKHEKEFIKYLNQKYNDQGETYLDFLKENRIELNTIMTQIGAKRFWNWLYSKIISIFPTRNYLRVIRVPPYEITLPVLDKLNKIVEGKIKDCIEDEKFVIIDELYRVEGFLNTEIKTDEIDDRLNDVVNEDEDITKFNTKLKRVVKSVFKIEVD